MPTLSNFVCDVILQGGKREVLANEFGERTTPTLVTYLENEKVADIGCPS